MKKRGYQEGGRVSGKLGNYIFDEPIEQELMEHVWGSDGRRGNAL